MNDVVYIISYYININNYRIVHDHEQCTIRNSNILILSSSWHPRYDSIVTDCFINNIYYNSIISCIELLVNNPNTIIVL